MGVVRALRRLPLAASLGKGRQRRRGGAEQREEGLEASDVHEALAVGAVGRERGVERPECAAARVAILLESQHHELDALGAEEERLVVGELEGRAQGVEHVLDQLRLLQVGRLAPLVLRRGGEQAQHAVRRAEEGLVGRPLLQ